MKKWELNYGENIIVVENRWSGERLYINGTLQDEQVGFASRARLYGKLDSGEKIKVSLGGYFAVHCRVFIDDKLALSK